jgi:hypothetical protein
MVVNATTKNIFIIWSSRYMLLVGLVIGAVIGLATMNHSLPALYVMKSISSNVSTWLVAAIMWASVPYHFWGPRVRSVRFLLNCLFFIVLNNFLGSVITATAFYFMVTEFPPTLEAGQSIAPQR